MEAWSRPAASNSEPVAETTVPELLTTMEAQATPPAAVTLCLASTTPANRSTQTTFPGTS